ncbi:MAG: DUF1634 domain-containing protein [Niabella sp.]
MNREIKHNKPVRDIKGMTGNLMRWGVITALSLAFIGGVVFLVRHGGQTVDHSVFTEQDHSIADILKQVVSGVANGSGRAIITLGILVLFATPFLRVLFTLIWFIYEKDKTYIVITAIVLLGLIISIMGGFGH